MSQTKSASIHRLTIRSKTPGRVTTGASTEVFLDGVPFKGISFLKLEVKAGKATKVVVEMYADVEVDADLTEFLVRDSKPGETHEIGNYVPRKFKP